MNNYIWTKIWTKQQRLEEVFISVSAESFVDAVEIIKSSYQTEYGVECPYVFKVGECTVITPKSRFAFIHTYQTDGW